MLLPKVFYAKPCWYPTQSIHAVPETSDRAPLSKADSSLAMEYYRVEAYATKKERDLSCGPTEHLGVHYQPVTHKALSLAGYSIEKIGCGHSIDSRHFEHIFNPIFDAAVSRLIKKMVQTPESKRGIVAEVELSISRALYAISTVNEGAQYRFEVRGVSLFENIQVERLERTVKYLKVRLAQIMSISHLVASP